MLDLQDLNDRQRQAAQHIDGPLLVLAGAGSGKTRVLTYRIANLIENHHVSPWNILALTFTNKAAREMRERTERLISTDPRDMWVMTFHSCCARLLRREIEPLGYTKSFVIYDADDQMSLINTILKEMRVDDKQFPKRLVKDRISSAKNHPLRPLEFLKEESFGPNVLVEAYKEYEKRLMRSNALDFDDLILKTIELFERFPEVLQKYRDKFRYILVDEYQDTNMAQYRLVGLLAGEHKNLCVVGDDDQSIYGWRGADIRNILEFEKDFPGATVVRLEQNYRSTSVILDAANGVIENNMGRKRKRLWTVKEGGAPINRFDAENERHEADYICSTILNGARNGKRYDDFAVLYRMNAQSRVLETALSNYGIPYQVFGGTRFYERKEIKDVMAYLRLISNPADDVSFERIVNLPRRGIGDGAMNELALDAVSREMPLFLAAMEPGNGVSGRVRSKLKDFAQLITDLISVKDTMGLSDFARHVLDVVEYDRYLRDDKKESYEARAENVQELMGALEEFEDGLDPALLEELDPLQAFLENVALVADIDAMEEDAGQVSLMTLHSAKGLEFPVVLIPGMEETVFPSRKTAQEPTLLEEERRLCYVGITRAREELHLICTRQRTLFGSTNYNKPSRFFDEIPSQLFALPPQSKGENRPQELEARSAGFHSRPPASAASLHSGFGRPSISAKPETAPGRKAKAAVAFTVGQRVSHAKFGPGVILAVEGGGTAAVVQIDFGRKGVKKFAAAFAPITPEE